jgi:peptidoglycan/xylan/chitin deacetylase (PgdA/CDA1 family)
MEVTPGNSSMNKPSLWKGWRKSYFVKTPWWLKQLYPGRLWSVATQKKILYFTFDDGPHPEATVFVLCELKKYDALGTFFALVKMFWRGRTFTNGF